jgi:toxin secretion/phage lysis holin
MVKLQEAIEIFKSLVPDKSEIFVGGATGMAGAIVTLLFGEWTHALNALLIAMAIDYLTRVMAAAINPESKIDYRIGAIGLGKKAMILLIISLGHLADLVLGTNIICMGITYAYLANEGLSIIGNAEAAGVPVPNIVKAAYHAIEERSGSNAKL